MVARDAVADAGEGVVVGGARVDDEWLFEGHGGAELALEDGALGGVCVGWVFVVVEPAFAPGDAGGVGHGFGEAGVDFVGVVHGGVGVGADCEAGGS